MLCNITTMYKNANIMHTNITIISCIKSSYSISTYCQHITVCKIPMHTAQVSNYTE